MDLKIRNEKSEIKKTNDERCKIMKKSRILVLVLTLALIVCAAFAITASAEEGNVAILSKNVA